MNVLSLFDGMSCGRIALDKCGITPTHYFASEIDKHAIKVSKDNWSDITQPEDKGILLKDILTTQGEFTYKNHPAIKNGVRCKNYVQWDIQNKNRKCQSQRAYYVDGKAGTQDTVGQSKVLLADGQIRLLTALECERLQTVPDLYTLLAGESQAKRMLGNGWTVDVIAHILQSLKGEKC